MPPDHSRQLQIVQRFADGVALEMNNVLAAIIGHASVLDVELTQDSPARADIEAILSAGKVALDLTRDLLHFSHQYKFAQDELSLNEIVGKLCSMWKQGSRGQVQVEARLDPYLLPICGDEARLRHMLHELAVNANEAMHDAGALTLTTKNVRVDDGKAPDPSFGHLPSGAYVRLQVSDSGNGMGAETLKQAFEPMFSTKQASGAVGLGLTQVYDTVKRHGGEVQLFSRKGLGTTVTAYFPASRVSPSQLPKTVLEDNAGAGGTVLVVDDDVRVLTTGKRLLCKLGYKVLCTSDPHEAVVQYRKRQREITLVILDLIMPDLDGDQLLQQIRKLNPEARVLVCSGFDDDTARRNVLALGAQGFLPKPYTYDELRTAVKRALET